MLDCELERVGPLPLVDLRPVGRPEPRRAAARRAGRGWPRNARRLAPEGQLGVMRRRPRGSPRTSKVSSKVGGGQSLAPDPLAQAAAPGRRSSSPRRERAVALDRAREIRRRELLVGDFLERFAKRRQRLLAQRQPGGERVAAEAARCVPGALRHEVERVAQVESGDRPPEPRSSPLAARANTTAGRWKRSLSRAATMPTTPWCHSGRNRHSVRLVVGNLDRASAEVGERLVLHRRPRSRAARD